MHGYIEILDFSETSLVNFLTKLNPVDVRQAIYVFIVSNKMFVFLNPLIFVITFIYPISFSLHIVLQTPIFPIFQCMDNSARTKKDQVTLYIIIDLL